ncbi:MAG: hypothetical protein M0P74_08750 [Syntrophales bacterium]|nr:hypothetical protein [Syntrophales bacterium]
MKLSVIAKYYSIYALIVILAGMISCSGSLRNYGMINPSEGATGDFERSKVKTEWRYYVSGADLYPNAILGLPKELQLAPGTLWKSVAMTPEKMKELVGDMKAKTSELSQYLYGFELTTPQGAPLGAWYSIPTARTMLRLNEDGTIWVETPDIDTYEKFETKMEYN